MGFSKGRTTSAAFKRKVQLGTLNRLDTFNSRVGMPDTSKIINSLDRMRDILDARLAARKRELSK